MAGRSAKDAQNNASESLGARILLDVEGVNFLAIEDEKDGLQE